MSARTCSIFVSKAVIVGALCALLWVVRPMGDHPVKVSNDPVAREVQEVLADPAEVLVPPEIKDAPLPARQVSAPLEEGDEGTVEAKPELPYHSVTDRPQLTMSGSRAAKKKEGVRATFPL
ncbi:MAG: hypothetical protein JWO82_720 [Akkermansiaceae bacterium]|nr:hypothetical protein [Akkermansiaceae bacterium]